MLARMSQTLVEVVALLERLAPLDLAEDWDNVGLLLEPSAAAVRAVSRALLCIDLSESVLREAIERGAGLIVAYHPPIFRGLKRVRASSAEERVALLAIEAGLAIYSPHTALDATENGVNDWLARGLGTGASRPLIPHSPKPGSAEYKLVVFVPRSHVDDLRSALSRELGAGNIGNYSECSYELEGKGSFFGSDAATPQVGERGRLEFLAEIRLEMRLARAALTDLARVIRAHHPYEEPAWDLYPLAQIPHPSVGAGRLLELTLPITLSDAVARLKAHLGVPTLRVACSDRHGGEATIRRIALCAGAGGSVLESVTGVDLFVTGEMRHHDVLSKLRCGASVILSEHTHTERGFLPEFARRLGELAGGQIEVLVSTRDEDPLRTC